MAPDLLAGISEDYYQISEAVLSSFPKYRLPLDLYLLQEDVVQLVLYSKKDSRLSNEQVEEIPQLIQEGLLFVSRADHPIYSKHIVKQLDLVLLDDNLKEAEIADIFLQALAMRLEEFFEQPVKPVFERLHQDAMVLTEYLWADKHRIKLFMRRLFKGDHTLAHQTLNTLAVGLWLFMHQKGDELTRPELNNYTLGFLLHDVGMSKVPSFILSKTTQLLPDDRDKIHKHVLTGAQVAHKLELMQQDIKAACLEHHERLDGSGYPQKIKGDRMTRMGQICSVADSFAAMIQKRSYAAAKEPLQAAKELMEDAQHYEKHYSAALYTALVTGEFGKGV